MPVFYRLVNKPDQVLTLDAAAHTKTLLELVNTATSISRLLLTGVKRMAS